MAKVPELIAAGQVRSSGTLIALLHVLANRTSSRAE